MAEGHSPMQFTDSDSSENEQYGASAPGSARSSRVNQRSPQVERKSLNL